MPSSQRRKKTVTVGNTVVMVNLLPRNPVCPHYSFFIVKTTFKYVFLSTIRTELGFTKFKSDCNKLNVRFYLSFCGDKLFHSVVSTVQTSTKSFQTLFGDEKGPKTHALYYSFCRMVFIPLLQRVSAVIQFSSKGSNPLDIRDAMFVLRGKLRPYWLCLEVGLHICTWQSTAQVQSPCIVLHAL